MRTAFVSTMSLLNTPRLGITRMQQDLVRLNQEVVTGRMADVGLTLGARTAQSVTLHIDTKALDSLAASNATLSGRLQQTQAALDKMRTDADSFLGELVTARSGSTDWTIIARSARSALSAFTSTANTSDGRGYLFGGINTGTPPLAQFDAGPGAALDAAFLTKFGFTQDDPAAAGIDGAAMADFLNNEFDQLFADPDWGATWSSASSQNTSTWISLTEKVTTSVNANESAMRKLAEVYSMVGYLGTDGLGENARQAIADKAASLLGGAGTGLVDLQATLGAVQNQTSDASERLVVQQSLLQTRIGTLEGIDPAEAKVRIDTLSTQIEMSYSLTAKLLQMSILNYA